MGIKIVDTPQRMAMDVRGSAQDLRARFQKDPKAGLQAAAQQFEGLFLQMVMKSMRDTTPQDGLLHSDSTRFYTAMLDQQLAQNMANAGQLGFARKIEEQLGRQLLPGAGKEDVDAAVRRLDAVTESAVAASLPLTATSGGHLPGMGQGALPAAVPAVSTPASAPAATPAGDGVLETGKDFVNRVWPHAVEASRSTGIPPQFLVGHAALESAWGKSEIRRKDGSSSYNVFGIKAGKSWQGPTVEAVTTEYVDGQAQRVSEKFRAYGSYAEAFRDYANLLRNSPRYGGVIGSQDGTEFARRLQQAGYATDPMYADKLARTIHGPTLRQALIG